MKYTALGFATLILLGFVFTGCGPTNARVNDPTDLRGYVESANRTKAESNKSEGSLWSGSGYRSNLFRDSKARYIDDVVTIRVSETTQAAASADAKNTKSTSASAGFDNLFGLEKAISELPTMVNGKSDTSFEGKGSTSRATALQTNLTARVVDVLPNGYLLVEGIREVRVNNENQTVHLTGVVRPDDISRNNIVLSSSVAQMSVRVEGKGIASQPIKPGWLFRILNGVMPF
jgi:flagellar L-ring protein precursor FlgH